MDEGKTTARGTNSCGVTAQREARRAGLQRLHSCRRTGRAGGVVPKPHTGGPRAANLKQRDREPMWRVRLEQRAHCLPAQSTPRLSRARASNNSEAHTREGGAGVARRPALRGGEVTICDLKASCTRSRRKRKGPFSACQNSLAMVSYVDFRVFAQKMNQIINGRNSYKSAQCATPSRVLAHFAGVIQKSGAPVRFTGYG